MQSAHSVESVEVHPPGDELRLYEDFPYLVTRLVSSLYHVIPLPEAFDEASLKSLARYQALCNQLPTCLVLETTRAIYIDRAGKESESSLPPRGGIVLSGRLKPSPGVERSPWWKERSRRLRTYVERQSSPGEGRYLLGDLTKDGRAASGEERRALQGTTENGILRGLCRCPTCGEWRGHCLDDIDPESIVTVSCLCENTHRCAACHGPLATRKLNANYFSVAEGKIYYVPGFAACSHRCLHASAWDEDEFKGGAGI